MKSIFKYFPVASMIIMLLGLLVHLFVDSLYGLYTFGFGAAVFAVIRLLELVQHHKNEEGKPSRLPQIRLFSAAALLGAAYLMYDGSNSWSVLLLLSAVLEIYVSFRQK